MKEFSERRSGSENIMNMRDKREGKQPPFSKACMGYTDPLFQTSLLY
jgi:hypothetical protein